MQDKPIGKGFIMSDKAIVALGERVDQITIVLAGLIDACALYESAIIQASLGKSPVEKLLEAQTKRDEALYRLYGTTGGRLKRI